MPSVPGTSALFDVVCANCMPDGGGRVLFGLGLCRCGGMKFNNIS
jgi:hypothetical protein